MQDRLEAEAAETGMAVDDFDLLPDDNVAEYWEEREDCRERRLAIDDEEGNMIDLQPISQVSDASSASVGVGNDDDFVATVDQLGTQLVDVALHSARLRKEEVADHRNVVRHLV